MVGSLLYLAFFFVKSAVYLKLTTGKSMACNLSYGLKTQITKEILHFWTKNNKSCRHEAYVNP